MVDKGGVLHGSTALRIEKNGTSLRKESAQLVSICPVGNCPVDIYPVGSCPYTIVMISSEECSQPIKNRHAHETGHINNTNTSPGLFRKSVNHFNILKTSNKSRTWTIVYRTLEPIVIIVHEPSTTNRLAPIINSISLFTNNRIW